MAPEQLAGTEVTERSDLFSLGLVLYEIYTGKRAFDATTIAEYAEARRGSASAERPRAHDPARVVISDAWRGAARAAGQRMAYTAAMRGVALPRNWNRGTPSPAMSPRRPHGRGAAADRLALTAAIVVGSPCSSACAAGRLPTIRAGGAVGPVLEYSARQAVARLAIQRPAVEPSGAVTSAAIFSAWRGRAPRLLRQTLGSGRTPGFGYWIATPRGAVPIANATRPRADEPHCARRHTLATSTRKVPVGFLPVPPRRVASMRPTAERCPGADRRAGVSAAVGWPRDA